ncbi:MAG: hypothetical protein MI749_01885, partial [Desulfovibrionales bacterium]|nr:hypothetical protein [Desulfovibrionales bacterium]
MKKFLLSLTLIFFAATAFAAGPVDTSKAMKGLTKKDQKKEFVIATVVKVDGIAWFDRMRDGVKQFSKETGHDAWMMGPSQA